jgi:dTDP-4-dehydrorhamnose reductase
MKARAWEIKEEHIASGCRPPSLMRITIFGATGLLGKSLMHEFARDEVNGFGSRDADIRDPLQVSALVKDTQPEWIILAAAYTDVDGCESNRKLAFDVNCRGAANVARAAKECESKLLFVSTDYVFDGTKTTPYETDDPRNPQSVYGRTKAEAEAALMQIAPQCCIVRTSWLFGIGGRCFPETILKLAEKRSAIDVVDDQRGSPTYAPDVAYAISQLCRQQASGIVHATNGGECTWFEFARELVSASGLATVVRSTTSDRFVRPARRPKYSVLSGRSLNLRGVTLPSWQDAVGRYVRERNDSLPI